ncbi:DUF3732 domain-containing protein [Subsaxibacter sp. CAU 1640]|uniref:DUF3732 domain-containing protein n=1 Tax=Subsaxibacter sp. CAU 1640 TaxID=2933271 RepID=UPI002004D353|nr:DUF3732 domain-containing protein [Subsaxibacter sp. CAU 1640]MCK7590076.1 DUF3732 domain-containing protein [Subsaxibacter sp. CAU 1640]
MKFVLHDIKLWFNDETAEPKNYKLLPNKINVITGDSTKGKTSFWNIIDYCLMAGKVTIPTEVINRVQWFGIRFSINKKEVSIIRKSPVKGAVSSEVYFNLGMFPDIPFSNSEIAEIKSFLDEEFGINDNLRFPFGKEAGKAPFNISYRYFLLFNSLTQTIIDAPETYFDTTFYGKEEYDKALNHIFDLVIGINDMNNIKGEEKLKLIDKKLKSISNQEKRNKKKLETFKSDIFELVNWGKKLNLIEFTDDIEDIDTAILTIKEIVKNTRRIAQNTSLFSEIDKLEIAKNRIQSQINSITQYQREYDIYKRNLTKSADSLQPIEFLNQKMSDQLLDIYEVKVFIDYLDGSLKSIKNNLSNKAEKPLKVEGDIKELKTQLETINKEISKLNEIKKGFLAEGEKFIELGKIEYALEKILKEKEIKPIDTIELNRLLDEKNDLVKQAQDNPQIKSTMEMLLNDSIQRNYDKLTTLQNYRNSKVRFNSDRMLLELIPEGQLFALPNVGSASNYMLMHLCTYLGLHEHVINLEQENVPPFLFIDQPSTPYFGGNNDDEKKLLDAFNLLNSFIKDIVHEKKSDFQIFMVEHAAKEFWIENNLTHFHTVDEFIDGNGLIPSKIYNK